MIIAEVGSVHDGSFGNAKDGRYSRQWCEICKISNAYCERGNFKTSTNLDIFLTKIIYS